MIFDKLPEQRSVGAPGSEERKQFINENYEKFLEEYNEAIEGPILCSYELDFDELIDETYNANIPKLGRCTITVHGGEGTIPHFHVTSNQKHFLCCVKFFECAYFAHGHNTSMFFDKAQPEFLDKFLRELDPDLKKSRWEVLRDEWVHGNPESKHPMNWMMTEQPDYTQLPKGKKPR